MPSNLCRPSGDVAPLRLHHHSRCSAGTHGTPRAARSQCQAAHTRTCFIASAALGDGCGPVRAIHLAADPHAIHDSACGPYRRSNNGSRRRSHRAMGYDCSMGTRASGADDAACADDGACFHSAHGDQTSGQQQRDSQMLHGGSPWVASLSFGQWRIHFVRRSAFRQPCLLAFSAYCARGHATMQVRQTREWSRRRVRDLVAHLAFEGRSLN